MLHCHYSCRTKVNANDWGDEFTQKIKEEILYDNLVYHKGKIHESVPVYGWDRFPANTYLGTCFSQYDTSTHFDRIKQCFSLFLIVNLEWTEYRY